MPVAAHQVGDPEQLPGLCRGELEKLLFGIGGMIPQLSPSRLASLWISPIQTQ